MSPLLGGLAVTPTCHGSSQSSTVRSAAKAAWRPLCFGSNRTAVSQSPSTARLSSSTSVPGISGSSSSEVRRHLRLRRQQQPVAAAAAADADAGLAAQAAAAAAVGAEADRQQAPLSEQFADAAGAAAGTADLGADAGALGEAGDNQPKKKSSLAKRVVFGVILGLSGAAVIITGGWLYGAVTCLAAYQLSQEFTGLVRAKGIAKGMPPPPPLVSSAVSLLCVALNAWVFVTNGRAASAMAVATFMCLSLQLLAVRKPRFSQLASSLFGLFYCGYLPSFWIKLRLMAVPAVNSGAIAAGIPPLLGGPTHLTVGLIAAFVAVSCIIAADTGAYFCGKSFGRTQLTAVSPKKTVEGAVGGLLSSIAVALGLYKVAGWPDNSLNAAALGTIVFFASLFGDLIESVIKRDAGLKDASNLIPGHGGLLDRLDSYLFTGACVYFFIKFCLGNCGI